MLRFDPPVHFRIRTTLTDINIAGVTIPKGATVVLLFASGSRDPARFVSLTALTQTVLTINILALAEAFTIVLEPPLPASKLMSR